MSAAKMVADSTQAEPETDGRKRKKKVKKQAAGKKVSLPEDDDSDLDLRRDLKPISAHIKSRSTMIEEMFRAVRGASLQRALPDLLKSIPLEELKVHCLEQLEVMSKKRIRRILGGEESANISSSGTEDETTDEEAATTGDDKPVVTEAQPADSTVTQDNVSKPEETVPPPSNFVSSFEQVEIKQEPQDSAEEDYPVTGDREEEEEREDETNGALEEEDEDEEAEENYTSGSEDGELVRREDQGPEDLPEVKQEPVSDLEQGQSLEIAEEGPDIVEEQEGGDEEGGEMMDQMELLELEMRARAIKAMLSTQEEGDI